MNVNGLDNLNTYSDKLQPNNAQKLHFGTNATSPIANKVDKTPEIDTFELSGTSNNTENNNQSTNLSAQLQEIKSKQGLIGKAWDGFKNFFHFGASSNKVEAKIEAFKNGEISLDEAQEAIDKYSAGQDMVLDVAADMTSGILAVGAFAFAVPVGGASLAVALGLATATGAGVKVGIKGSDAILNKREYSTKDLIHDSITGAINGLLAPVTNGIGASVTKTVGKKLGLTVVKEGTQEVVETAAKQGIKSIITQQGVDVIGGTFTKRAAATALGMAADGAIGGASDNMVRAALNGEDVAQAGVQGAIGGLIMAPIIGGGFKLLGKAGKSLNNQITTSSVLPDGVNTRFSQGTAGDCALLSTIDGLMSNPQTADKIKHSITKSIAGDYNVTIGNQTVRVAKSQLTDEMLSDVTGIRIFEQAYKQIADGGLDGGFAEAVAKQFGLNPLHITTDGLTDEVLDRLSKEQSSCVLSFGAKVNADGVISTDGANHYFTIKGIDPQAKKITLADTYSTAKTFDIGYDEAKRLGLSIDGGTTKALDLPSVQRAATDVKFRGLGQSVQLDKGETATCAIADIKELLTEQGLSNGKIKKIINQIQRDDAIDAPLRTFDDFEIRKISETQIQITNAAKRANLETVQNAVQKEVLSTQQMLDDIIASAAPFKSGDELSQFARDLQVIASLDESQIKAIYNSVSTGADFNISDTINGLTQYKGARYYLYNTLLRPDGEIEINGFKFASKMDYLTAPKDMGGLGYTKTEVDNAWRGIKKLSRFLSYFNLEEGTKLTRTDTYNIFKNVTVEQGQYKGQNLMKLLQAHADGSQAVDIRELTQALSKQDLIQHGFLSTSAVDIGAKHGTRADRPILWNLRTQAKTAGCYIDVYAKSLSDEFEFLIDKGSKINIQGLEFDKILGSWQINALLSSN